MRGTQTKEKHEFPLVGIPARRGDEAVEKRLGTFEWMPVSRTTNRQGALQLTVARLTCDCRARRQHEPHSCPLSGGIDRRTFEPHDECFCAVRPRKSILAEGCTFASVQPQPARECTEEVMMVGLAHDNQRSALHALKQQGRIRAKAIAGVGERVHRRLCIRVVGDCLATHTIPNWLNLSSAIVNWRMRIRRPITVML